MELATNTFSKGLLMDTSPMVLGNDSLTDCLNGTLITMNGNEVILLNDMGNRRVNNAFLPSGYLPVGMKEYGGIIYVAAYNPITNKSLVGSFPSPLRKIDSSETSEGVNLNLNSFFENRDENYNINSDTILIPLTKDTSLHAGDKFSIYCNNLSTFKPYITNYDNVSDNKAYSPKNRKYTLLIGILNSQNEFVDITKTLCRWEKNNQENKWEVIDFDSSNSDLYKFNRGYFISDEFNNGLLQETDNDANLIKTRLKMAINTYAYKLTGPLYLKAILNHILNFDYNIYGTYNKENKKASIYIESYVVYNCPDGVEDSKDENKTFKEYKTFEEGIPTFLKLPIFDLECNSPEGDFSVEEELLGISYSKSKYDSSSNTYSVKLTRKFNIILNNKDNTIFDYTLKAIVETVENKNYYLKGLSLSGSIDLSLLGSGQINIKGWKFYNTVAEDGSVSTLLKFTLDAYPEYNKEFRNLSFIFEEEGSNNKKITSSTFPIYNGRLTISLNWNKECFRKVYKVKLQYEIFDILNNKNESTITIEENIWFITTELFNEFYNNPDIEKYYDTENEDFINKFKIPLYVDDDIKASIISSSDTQKGGFISTTNELINNSIEHYRKIEILGNPKLKIKNEELYPDFISINNYSLEVDSYRTRIKNKETNEAEEAFYNEIIKEYGENLNETYPSAGSAIKINPEYKKGTSIKLEVTYYDRFNGTGSNNSNNKLINIFDHLYKLGNSYKEGESSIYGLYEDESLTHNGVIVAKHERNPGDDYHYVLTVKSPLEAKPEWNDIDFNKLVIRRDDVDGTKIYSLISDLNDGNLMLLEEAIYNLFKELAKEGQIFTFIFPKGRKYSRSFDTRSNSYPADNAARVWWRTTGDRWALIDSLYLSDGGSIGNNNSNSAYITNYRNEDSGDTNKIGNRVQQISRKRSSSNSINITTESEEENTKFAEYLNKVFKLDFIYCRYSNFKDDSIALYYTTDNYWYFRLYSIPVGFSLLYKTLSDININLSNNNFETLKFEIGDIDYNSNSWSSNIVLSSDLKFLESIDAFLSTSQEIGFDLVTGNFSDVDGNPLNKEIIYYRTDNNQLKPFEFNKFKLVEKLTIDKENRLMNIVLLNDNNVYRGTPYFKYDSIWGSNDGTTHIDYTNILLVDKNICK